MVTTRRQKSLIVPVVDVKPKTRNVIKTRKNAASSKPVSVSSADKLRTRGRKRPIADDAVSPTPKQSKRRSHRRTVSPLPQSQQDELPRCNSPLQPSPALEPLQDSSPRSDVDVDQSPTAETKPRDPPISKAAHGDSHFVEDLPSTPLALNAPVDNLAILEASLSEDENALAFLRSRAVEGHIRRLAYHKTIEEVDIVPHETSITLKTTALPHLEGTAMIVLHKIAKAGASDIMAMRTEPDSTVYQEFDYARAEFVKLRWLFSKRQVLLNALEMGLLLPEYEIAIKRANLASYLSAFFGKQDLGFQDLNKHFLSILVADGDLTKDTQSMLLDLKSQAFLAGIQGGDGEEDMLEELFGKFFHEQLREAGRGDPAQIPGTTEFIARCERRRAYLKKAANTHEGLAHIKKKFEWKAFLVGLAQWTKKNFSTLTGRTFEEQDKIVYDLLVNLEKITPSEVQATASTNNVIEAQQTKTKGISNEDEIAEKAARAADLVMQDFGNPQFVTPTSQQYQQIHFQQPTQQNGYYVFDNNGQGPTLQQSSNSNQTDSSLQTQYHQARLTANTKASNAVRRPGTPSSRRPWTAEEEAALMQGLDEVGPHWSQILAHYGGDGTVSKVLKDRNQVQLKDKARNLKLWFLKQGKPVPDSLSQVTGELKTRAPTLASRQNDAQADSPQSTNYQPQASSPLAARERASTSYFSVTPTPLPHQNIASAPASTVDTGLTGSDADLEAALAAAERAGLESS